MEKKDKHIEAALDIACAVYNFSNSTSSKLSTLGLPNGSNAETIVEAIDKKLGTFYPGPIEGSDTSTIRSSLTGLGNKDISFFLKISNATGNTAVILTDGLNVPLPKNLFKVQVDDSHIPYYLDNALLGGSDGIISLTFNSEKGIIRGRPSMNLFSMVTSIVNNADAITNLTTSVVNTITNNTEFLNSLTKAIENNILNDSNFITNLTKEVLANPIAFADLCAALAFCSGTTTCECPVIISSAIGIETSGDTAVITLNFDIPSPPPVSYTVKYRLKGTQDYTTVEGFESSPIQLFGVPIGDYEGLLFSDCSGTTYFQSGTTLCPSGATWSVDLSCTGATAIPYSFVLGNSCVGTKTTLYTVSVFHIGSILYSDPGLTKVLTGWSQVVYNGVVYNVNVVTGEVLSVASICPISPNFIVEDLQTISTATRYFTPDGITGLSSPVAGRYEASPYFDGVFNNYVTDKYSATSTDKLVAKYSRYSAGSASTIITVIILCTNCGSGPCFCDFADVNLYVDDVLIQTIESTSQSNQDTIIFNPIDTTDDSKIIKITLTPHV